MNGHINPVILVPTGAEAPGYVQNPIAPGNSRINPIVPVPTAAEAPDYVQNYISPRKPPHEPAPAV